MSSDYEYIKAYYVRELCSHHLLAKYLKECGLDIASSLEEDSVLFLHDDLSLTTKPFSDSEMIFKDNSDEWKTLCKNCLGFNRPDSIDDTK